ncbi:MULTISPECIES: acyl-CoA carboxylase subunit epsilon [Streptomyces]|uniref:acyl-CoA carboxylase subunit epsilon n=1 Tax=Streptomyces TaxID=1883 RepID=UPI001F167EB7|nr:acyl-CoA carboxylase subunit epsilon [Streptomyces olivochromogenes]MCF3136757.1 acyl-CoA carboxylase subunit epsilon [Streptomyces olivochromogenes]
MESGETVLRIERGRATDVELAAVAIVLCAMLAGRGESDGDEQKPNVPLWRPERDAAAYRSPYNWR